MQRGGQDGWLAKVMSWAYLVLAYLLGTVPFALLVTRCVVGTDVREVGSGNVGAANAWRASRPLIGVLVLGLDVAKGSIAVLLVLSLTENEYLATMAAAISVSGHMFPLWLGFRGGKGVATACGAFAVLEPLAVLAALMIFVGVVYVSRYVSLGSIVAVAIFPGFVLLSGESTGTSVVAVITAVFIVGKHYSNFQRLLAGQEPSVTLRTPRRRQRV